MSSKKTSYLQTPEIEESSWAAVLKTSVWENIVGFCYRVPHSHFRGRAEEIFTFNNDGEGKFQSVAKRDVLFNILTQMIAKFWTTLKGVNLPDIK